MITKKKRRNGSEVREGGEGNEEQVEVGLGSGHADWRGVER